jgi:hypothetical protein
MVRPAAAYPNHTVHLHVLLYSAFAFNVVLYIALLYYVVRFRVLVFAFQRYLACSILHSHSRNFACPAMKCFIVRGVQYTCFSRR